MIDNLSRHLIGCFALLFLLRTDEALIYDSLELNCDFQGILCAWKSEKVLESDLEWSVQSIGTASIVRNGVLGPADYFLIVTGRDRPSEIATLVSDTIGCQNSTGVMGFFLWKTSPDSKLELCIRRPPGRSGNVNCIAEFIGYRGEEWFPVSIPVPSSDGPFEILIMGFVSRYSDTLALDKLVYDAEIACTPPPSRISEESRAASHFSISKTQTSSSHRSQQVSPSREERKSMKHRKSHQSLPVVTSEDEVLSNSPIELTDRRPVGGNRRQQNAFNRNDGISLRGSASHENELSSGSATLIFDENQIEIRCEAMECDFERNDTCEFEIIKLVPGAAGVGPRCSPLEDSGRLVKPPSGKCFLLSIASTEDNVMQIIASKGIFTTVYTELKFWYYLPPDDSAQLMVCLNGLDNCIWKTTKPKRGLIRWWKQSLQIPRGRNQLYFVVLQWKPNSTVGLDEIRLTQIRAPNDLAFCQVYAENE